MKFGSLLKKELNGLLTPQAIFSMFFTCILLIIMGQCFGGVMNDITDSSAANVCDLDNTEYTAAMLKNLSENGTEATMYTLESDNYAAELERLGIKNLVIIPEGFTKSIFEDKSPAPIKFVSKLTSGMSAMGTASGSDAVSAVEKSVSDDLLLKEFGLSEEEIKLVNEPSKLVEFTAVNGKTAEISADALAMVIMSTSLIVPMAVFFLILLASQMIMSAIATEKIDKTLETLLSAPVPRITVLTAKMVSALIVALLNSVSMIIGMIGYMMGMMSGAVNGAAASTQVMGEEVPIDTSVDLPTVLSQLGITFNAGSIILVGLQLFISVAIGLSVALVLGALCDDIQSQGTLIMPLMMLVMIPFFGTLFTDINEMSPVIKALFYIIPFTHSYMSVSNLMFGHMEVFWGGLAYQTVFLIICMTLAVKLFTSDKIFTMSGLFSQKKNTALVSAKK